VGGGVTSAETAFAGVSHRRPSWSSDGNSIYYDAPQAEDADNNLAVWKLDLDTQQKCEIALDINSNFDVDVSSKLVTRTVPNFNFINSRPTRRGCRLRRSAHLALNYVRTVVTTNVDACLNGGSGSDVSPSSRCPKK
jgi:hypothetical protein